MAHRRPRGRRGHAGRHEQLRTIQVATFEGRNCDEEIVEKTWNELDVERQNLTSKYLSNMFLISSPGGSEIRQRKPGMVIATLPGLILGGMSGILAALAAGQWHANDHVIGSPKQA